MPAADKMGTSGDSAEVLARFEEGLVWVRPIAQRVRASTGLTAELDELISYGRTGLLLAARRFDPERGVPFRAFATFRIKGAMLDGVREMAYLPRRIHDRVKAARSANEYLEGAAENVAGATREQEGAADRDRRLGEHLAGMATAMAMGLVAASAPGDEGAPVAVAQQQTSPEELSTENELLRRAHQAVAELPEPEQTIVRRHYFEGAQFEAVASELRLSRPWTSRLHARAIERLTRRLKQAS